MRLNKQKNLIKMEKNKIEEIILSEFRNKDVGIGLLYCISEDEQLVCEFCKEVKVNEQGYMCKDCIEDIQHC